MSQIQSVPELVGMLRRRALIIVFVALAGCIASVWFALSQPRAYEAVAVIQIEAPRVSESATPEAVTSTASRRLQLIQQRLMARDRLVEVIEKYELFADAPSMPMSQKIFQLRSSTQIEQIRSGGLGMRPDAPPSGLRVSVRLGEPELAADVANEFVNALLRQNLERRVTNANETLEFYSEEEASLSEEIAAVEAEIAEFKRANAEALPSGLTQLRGQLSGLENTVLEINRQIISLEASTGRQRLAVSENQIGLLEQQKNLVQDRITQLEGALASAPSVERQFNALNREMTDLQEQLAVVTRRRADAEMTQVLENRQQSERFEVLETALPPEYPVTASRKKIAALGGAVSVIAAFALAFVLEVFNPAIRSAAQLERALGISPVVSIPAVTTPMERRRSTLIWIGGLALLFAGLPLILRTMTERFGFLKVLGGN